MKVTLIANTTITGEKFSGSWETNQWMTTEAQSDWRSIPSADHLAEFAGRSCYQSFNRPNPKTATNADYLANILGQQHFSVLEHASATFYIEGVSRSLTHELVRHRHLSFSQLSQRYVDEGEAGIVVPPALLETQNIRKSARSIVEDIHDRTKDAYQAIQQILDDNGITGKKAKEAARAFLTNMTKTKIVVTGNHRAWREFLTKRLSTAADAEIQELAREILRELHRIAPNTYQDFKYALEAGAESGATFDGPPSL